MSFAFKSILAAATVAVSVAASTVPAAAADRYVKIINNTSVILYRFYASPSNSRNWGQDRLVSKQIPSGYNSTINLNRASGGCTFDIRAEFIDGDYLEKFGVNVCGGYTITYHE